MMGVMREGLVRAGLEPRDIDYVNAHATARSTAMVKRLAPISGVFGSQTPVSSLKGHMGHSLAACGALEAIAACK